uniref:Pentatricopeptide repeat-containing protein n=1 Tax=Kalanchoe fedtschenkoi TaxID=63787 RepID=A0A7N0TT77_KALFE
MPPTRVSIQSLLKIGVPPALPALRQHLLFLCLTRRYKAAVYFFAQMVANHFYHCSLTPSIVTRALLECDDFHDLAHLLDAQMTHTPNLPATRICDSLIKGLSDKDSERALSLLKLCLHNNSGMMPSSSIFSELLLCFCSRGDMSRAVEVLELMMTHENVGYSLDNFVSSFIIASFCHTGKPELAVGFFQKTQSHGSLRPNLVTYTALVNAYCLLGRVDDVGNLFSKMESEGIAFDVVFYTSWMAGYLKQGFLHVAISKYRQMVEGGIEPDEVCYTMLIDGFSKGGNVEKAVGLLHRMKKDGLEPNLLTYTSIISAFCKKGKFEEALFTYKIVKALGLAVDEVAFSTLINGACKLGKFDEAYVILNDFRKSSLSSVECYQCIILGLCRNGMASVAIDLFIEINEKGLVFDIGTYMILVKAALREQGAAGVFNLVHMIENLPSELFGLICKETIILLCKRGIIDTAFDLYIMMASKGFVTSSRVYYSILKGLLTEGKQRVTHLLLNKFIKEHGLTNVLVTQTVVRFLCIKNIEYALRFLQSMKDETGVTFPTTALTKLHQEGRALDAYNLVKGVENKLAIRNVVDFSILVNGLCKEGLIYIALDLCCFLKKYGIVPSIVTYNSIIHGLCHQGCFVEAFRLFDSFERLNLVPTVVTYSILIDALCKEGRLVKAEWLLGRMVVDGLMANTRTFNSLIDGYCKFGNFEKALELLYNFQSKGLKPDQFTISAVINGFILKGDVQGALDFFFEIKRKGDSPDFLGFLYLIRGLSTKGRMEEARGILKEMLQTKSVLVSINRVDAEIDTESIGSFLVDLCDRGSIKEAVTILDEVGRMLFPVGGTYKQKMFRKGATGNLNVTSSGPNIVGKHSHSHYFNHFYPEIASYCLEGELQNANSLVKQMLQQFSMVDGFRM